MPYNFRNSMEDVEKHLSERGLSIGTPQYESKYKEFKLRYDLNRLFGNSENNAMLNLNELSNINKGAKHINDLLKTNPKEALDLLYGDKGILNDDKFIQKVDIVDKDGNKIYDENGDPIKKDVSIGYFASILNRDKEIEKGNINDYDNSEEHKKILKEIEDYKHLLNNPSTYTSEYNPAPSYFKHIRDLEKLDETRRKEYSNEEKLPEYTEKYKQLLDENPEEKEKMVDYLTEQVKKNDKRFTEYLEHKNIKRSEESNELLRADIESILPEYLARDILAGEDGSSLHNWYQNRLMDNLYKIQPTTQKFLRSAAKFGDIILESALYAGALGDAIFGDYEIQKNPENGNEEIVVTIKDYEGHEYKTAIKNNLLNRFLNSDLTKYANDIEETGAWSKEKQEQLKKEGVNKHQIYNVGEDRDLSEQFINLSTLAETGAQTAFTVATAGEGALAGLLTKRIAKYTTIGVNSLFKALNASEKLLERTNKVLRYGSDLLVGTTYVGVAGGSESFFNANETYRNILDANIRKILDKTGNVLYDDSTPFEVVKEMPIYKEVLEREKERQRIDNENAKPSLEGQTLTISPDSPAIEYKAYLETQKILNNMIQEAGYEASYGAISDWWKNACLNGVVMAAFKTSLQLPFAKRAINSIPGMNKMQNIGGFKPTSKGGIGNLELKTKFPATAYILRPVKNDIGEIVEEGLQNVFDETSVAGSSYAFDYYLFNQLNGDGSMMIGDDVEGRFDASFDEFKKSIFSKNTIREAAMGGLGAVLPSPGLGFGKNMIRKSSRTKGDNESTFDYIYRMFPAKSPVIDEIMNVRQESREKEIFYKNIENAFNSEDFREKFKTMSYLGNLSEDFEGEGFTSDRAFEEFIAKTGTMINQIENTEFGKSMIEYLNKLKNTDFNSQNEEDARFIQQEINEYKKSEEFEKSKTKKDDKDIFEEKKAAATKMLEAMEKSKKSERYIDSIYGNNIDPFLKEYLTHVHLMISLIDENNKSVEKKMAEVFSKINDFDITEDEGKVHYSDLSKTFKRMYISYGSNYESVRDAWADATKEYRRGLNKLENVEGYSKKRLKSKLKILKKELDDLKRYVNFLDKNKGKLDIFVNTKDIANMSANQRNTFLNRKDGKKQKYGSKQNAILNNLKSSVDNIIKNSIKEGEEINTNWFREANQYMASAELYTESALNDLNNMLQNPDTYLRYAMDEAEARGREEGEKEGKKYNFDSGSELYDFFNKLGYNQTGNSIIDDVKNKARLNALVGSVLNKKFHEGHEKAIEEYEEMKKKYDSYMKAKKDLKSIGFSANKSDRAVANSAFLFLIKNGVNINDLNESVEFLRSHRDEYEKFVRDWNENDTKKRNQIPLYNLEDEIVEYYDEDNSEYSQYVSNEGVITIFRKEFNAIEKYNSIENNAKEGNNNIEKPSQQSIEQKTNQQNNNQSNKPKESDAEIAFGKNNLKVLKNSCNLTKEEYEKTEKLIGEENVNTFEDLLDKIKHLDGYKEIYNKIKAKLDNDKAEENQRVLDRNSNNPIIYIPGRTVANTSENLSLNGDTYSSENIDWLINNIDNIKNEDEKSRYKKVIDFYKEYILPNLNKVLNEVGNKDNVYIYRDDAGLYIAVVKRDNGNYTIDGEKYMPIAIMPSRNDNSQQGCKSFYNKYGSKSESGFITNSENNPIAFNRKATITTGSPEERFVYVNLSDYAVDESDSSAVKHFKLGNVINKLGINRTNAHKNIEFQKDESTGQFIRIKSLFNTFVNINGEEKNVVSLFENENPDDEYLDKIFNNPLFRGFLWSINAAISDSNNNESDINSVLKTLKTRLSSYFWLTNGFKYNPYFKTRETSDGIRKEFILGIEGNGTKINSAKIQADENGNFKENDIKRFLYAFFRDRMYNEDGSQYKVNKNDPETNSGLTIQLNYENVMKVQENLNSEAVGGNYENLTDIDQMNYDRFNYLLDNGILYVKKKLSDLKYEGMLLVEGNENQMEEFEEIDDLMLRATTENQKNVLQEILKIQAEKASKKEEAKKIRDENGTAYTTVTKEAYGNTFIGNTNQASKFAGNELDELQRDFFGGRIYCEEGNYYLIKNKEKINVEDYYGFSKDVLYKILPALNGIRQTFPGMVFVTHDLYLLEELEFEDGKKFCAGELDMIGVDTVGNVVVFDFKSGTESVYKWKKQTELYKKLLSKKPLNVTSLYIIHTETGLSESATGTDVMTVDDLLKSERGRKILEKRYNLVLKNENGEDIEISEEEKQKINDKINILGYSSGSFLEFSDDEDDATFIGKPILKNMESEEIITQPENTDENEEECDQFEELQRGQNITENF